MNHFKLTKSGIYLLLLLVHLPITEVAGEVIAPENAYVSGANWYCNKGFKKINNSCEVMTTQELREQEARQAAMLEEYRIRQLMGVTGDDCETEWDSGAKVCVEVDDVTLDCSKNYDGYFRDCDVEISYDVRTDYKGDNFLDVNVECEANINYKKGTGFSGYDSDSDDESHNLYANGRGNDTIRISFYFSSYNEVFGVEVDDYECEIDSVYLW